MAKYLLSAMLLLGLTMAATAFAAPGCTMLDVGASTVVPHWTRTFAWSIDKTVAPDSWEFAPGEEGTSTYTVSVTKDAGTDAWWVEGFINVHNGNEQNTTAGLAVTATLRYKTGKTIHNVAADSPVVAEVGPLTQVWVPYRIELANPPASYGATAWQIFVEVEIDNHSGKTVGYKNTTATLDFTWPASPELINDTINVDDTNGSSWTFDASGEVSYDRTFTAADEGTVVNTATIRETGQSAEATVVITVIDDVTYSGSETAWAVGDIPFSDLGITRWGWVITYTGGTVTTPLYAGAAQNDLTKGTLVGNVTIEPWGTTGFKVTYAMDAPYALTEAHLYVGTLKPTAANPGGFQYKVDGLDNVGEHSFIVDLAPPDQGPFYLAIHGTVSEQD